MKIAFITNHLGQTGVNNVILDLVNLFLENGHQCCVYYLKTTESPMSFPCDTKSIDHNISQYDIIHAHGLGPMLWVMRNKKKIKSKNIPTPKFVTTLHCYCWEDFTDTYSKVKGIIMSIIFLLAARSFDKIVALSKHMMHYYVRWLPKERLTYAYNTRDIIKAELSETEQQEILGFKGNSTLIGMNCVLLYRKGIDVMLKAMTLLPPHFKLFIAGDGKERETFESLTKQYQLEGRVYFAGNKPLAHRYLPYYDIYALPSRSEGFPLSLLEAGFYKCKTVASQLPVVLECYNETEIKTFKMPSEEALKNAILEADKDEDLSENIYQSFINRYSPQVFYNTYHHIFNSLLQ